MWFIEILAKVNIKCEEDYHRIIGISALKVLPDSVGELQQCPKVPHAKVNRTEVLKHRVRMGKCS